VAQTDSTTVWVSDETWGRLNDQKDRGQTMDEIISDALDALEARE